jgi:hypothetical protein
MQDKTKLLKINRNIEVSMCLIQTRPGRRASCHAREAIDGDSADYIKAQDRVLHIGVLMFRESRFVQCQVDSLLMVELHNTVGCCNDPEGKIEHHFSPVYHDLHAFVLLLLESNSVGVGSVSLFACLFVWWGE